MINNLHTERVEERSAKIYEDITDVQEEREEVDIVIGRVEQLCMNSDAHRNDCHRVHSNDDNQVAPADTPWIFARYEVLGLATTILARFLTLHFQLILQIMGHHDDSWLIRLVELLKLFFLDSFV